MKISEAMEQHSGPGPFPTSGDGTSAATGRTHSSGFHFEMWEHKVVSLNFVFTCSVLGSVSEGAEVVPPLLSDSVQPACRQPRLDLQVESPEETLPDGLP